MLVGKDDFVKIVRNRHLVVFEVSEPCFPVSSRIDQPPDNLSQGHGHRLARRIGVAGRGVSTLVWSVIDAKPGMRHRVFLHHDCQSAFILRPNYRQKGAMELTFCGGNSGFADQPDSLSNP